MRYSRAVLSKFACAISNFQNKPLFCVFFASSERWLTFSMLDVLLSRWVFIHLSLHESVAKGIRDAQSWNEKEIYLMLSNNKFLGKCSCGRHPWIRLAMDCERMVEKGIKFILCLGTAYDVSSMESIRNSRSFLLTGKSCSQNNFISQFKLWALAPLQISASLCEGLIYLLYATFIFIWVSTFSYKAPTREHYCLTCALNVANIWVCFMNGSIT